MKHSTTVKLENTNNKSIRVWFEPWGDFRDLKPGQRFDLEFNANIVGKPEIERIEESVVVCAWPSATLTVKSAGFEVASFTVPVPDVPGGMRVSSFLELMLGKSSGEKNET